MEPCFGKLSYYSFQKGFFGEGDIMKISTNIIIFFVVLGFGGDIYALKKNTIEKVASERNLIEKVVSDIENLIINDESLLDENEKKLHKMKSEPAFCYCNKDACEIVFANKKEYLFHLLVCHDGQNAECIYKGCEKVLKDKNAWTDHWMNIHSLQCPTCLKDFDYRPALTMHILKDHPGQPYPCPSPGCPCWMYKYKDLKRHMKEKHYDIELDDLLIAYCKKKKLSNSLNSENFAQLQRKKLTSYNKK